MQYNYNYSQGCKNSSAKTTATTKGKYLKKQNHMSNSTYEVSGTKMSQEQLDSMLNMWTKFHSNSCVNSVLYRLAYSHQCMSRAHSSEHCQPVTAPLPPPHTHICWKHFYTSLGYCHCHPCKFCRRAVVCFTNSHSYSHQWQCLSKGTLLSKHKT